jgi:hypothetical protein
VTAFNEELMYFDYPISQDHSALELNLVQRLMYMYFNKVTGFPARRRPRRCGLGSYYEHCFYFYSLLKDAKIHEVNNVKTLRGLLVNLTATSQINSLLYKQ